MRVWEDMGVRVRIGRRLTLIREMPNEMKSCAPLAVAPEGWGCEGAIVAPSRTSASASRDEVGGGQVRALRAGGVGGEGGGELVLTCCARMSKDRSPQSKLKISASSHHLPNMEHMQHMGRGGWSGGVRRCVRFGHA